MDGTGLARLQRRALRAERDRIVELHRSGRINDEVFGRLEEEVDWLDAGLAPMRDGAGS